MLRPILWAHQSQIAGHFSRLASTTRSAARPKTVRQPDTNKQGLIFPELLAVYNAGALLPANIGLIRFVSLASCVAGLWYIALPNWEEGNKATALQVAVGTLFPPIITYAATRPFVATFSIAIPVEARVSASALQRWLQTKLSADTLVIISKLGPLGNPFKIKCRLGQVRTLPPQWGRMANYTIDDYRTPVLKFQSNIYIRDPKGNAAHVQAPKAWEEVAKYLRTPRSVRKRVDGTNYHP